MSREAKANSDYDGGLDSQYLSVIGWLAGVASLLAWAWLIFDVDEGGAAPAKRYALLAIAVTAAVVSVGSAVLSGVKNAEQRLRVLLRRRD